MKEKIIIKQINFYIHTNIDDKNINDFGKVLEDLCKKEYNIGDDFEYVGYDFEDIEDFYVIYKVEFIKKY